MAVQPGLCRTWSETPKTGFLTTRLILGMLLFPDKPVVPPRIGFTYGKTANLDVSDGSYLLFDKVYFYTVYNRMDGLNRKRNLAVTPSKTYLIEANSQLQNAIKCCFSAGKRIKLIPRMCFFSSVILKRLSYIGNYNLHYAW